MLLPKRMEYFLDYNLHIIHTLYDQLQIATDCKKPVNTEYIS